MSQKPKAWQLGDRCPACQGQLEAAAVPTDEQRQRFEDREIREPYPAGFDTATARDRERLGALHVCARCGYQARVALESAADAPAHAASGHEGGAATA